jgi:outer membrane immunogenic protein
MVWGRCLASVFGGLSNEIQKGRNAGEQVVWDDQLRTGLAVGGGIEYLFTDLGDVTLFNADGNRAVFKNELHLLRVGASYRF